MSLRDMFTLYVYSAFAISSTIPEKEQTGTKWGKV